MPKKGYKRTSEHQAKLDAFHRRRSRSGDLVRATRADFVISDAEVYARFVTAHPGHDIFGVWDPRDYIDTGFNLVPRAHYRALSGPCVVINPGREQ